MFARAGLLTAEPFIIHNSYTYKGSCSKYRLHRSKDLLSMTGTHDMKVKPATNPVNSLSESIFGSKAESKDAFALFSSTHVLPEKPHHVHYTDPKPQNKDTKSQRIKRKSSDNDDAMLIPAPLQNTKKLRSRSKQQEPKDGDNNLSENENSSLKPPRASKNKEDDTSDNKINPHLSSESRSSVTEEEEKTKIDEDEERTIFVGNLPLEITRKELASVFKSCGKVVSTRLRSIATTGVKVSTEKAGNEKFAKKIAVNTKSFLTDSPKKTAQGYVVFSHIEAVHKALLMNNQSITIPKDDGSNITVQLRVDHAKPTIDASKSVFVGNLPYAADETSLRKHFNSLCGWDDQDNAVINGVRIIRDPSTMRCKGFGYVLFHDKISIPDALRKVHQTTYMKRELRVAVCGRRLKSHNLKKKDSERKFEGKRSTDTMNSASRRILNKMKGIVNDPTKVTLLALKKSFEKTAQKTLKSSKKGIKVGISKNAALKKKTDQRIKKIQKRVSKGMGKQRKSNK